MAGATTVRSRLHAAAARGLTTFVGRDRELDQLRETLERARTGHGQVVAVIGEAGVGKSRLYWEFTHSHRTEGWLIVESSSVSYGKAIVTLKLDELLRGVEGARTGLVKLDHMSDEELEIVQEEFTRLRDKYAPLIDDDLAHVQRELEARKRRD